MKNFKNLLILVTATFLFFSCDKALENCIEDATGVYSGENCNGEATNIEIGDAAGDDQITVNVIGFYGVNGTIDENCNIILNSTDVTFTDDYGNFVINVSGTAKVVGNDLTITIIQDELEGDYFDGSCTFTISK